MILLLYVYLWQLCVKTGKRTGCPSVYTDPYRDRVPHDQSRVIIIQGFKVMLQLIDAQITKSEQNKNDRKCKKC